MSSLLAPSHNALIVRPHITITPEEREEVLRSVEYNVFAFSEALLTCDDLSDSGTSAMTYVQWAAMLRGDESYGRNSGYYCLLEAFRDVFERGEDRRCVFKDVIVALISNGFFDTTSANAAAAGFQLHTFTQPGLTDPFPAEQVGVANPFKGNLDVEKVSAFLGADGNAGRVAMLLLTITNNWAGAQPVSMSNIKAAADLAKDHKIPMFFDACRFAENAKFIQDFEAGHQDRSIPEIIQEMFAYADGFTISLKKDGLANMGGALCFRDQGIFPTKFGADIGIRLKERQIMCYGNDSYGGMSGCDVMAAAVGLYEVTKETYLADRIGQVRRFAEGSVAEGIPVLLPPGGHAMYLDMNGFFADCWRSYGEFASVGFTLELLKDYGHRLWHPGISATDLRTFKGEAWQDIEKLCGALDLDDQALEMFQHALDVSMQGWGHLTASEQPTGWKSDASLNLCPFEYSVAIDKAIGKTQLRFLIENQAEEATLEAHQRSAFHLTDEIQRMYPDAVSLDRFSRVKDLFFPPVPEAQGTFAEWHSFVAEDGSRPAWKKYLNANAQGESRASAVVHETLNRLRMPQAWTLLEKISLPGNKPVYLSLDLCPVSRAGVKIYVQHCGATAMDLSRAASIGAPDIADASDSEILHFCTALSGGFEGPYKGKGPMNCFSFTADGERRIETYLGSAVEKALKTYQRAVDAVARRPLQDGRGIHAWVGLRMTRSRGSVVTFYLASEMFGVLPKRS
ncbi:beta-eliminating lyase [Colletotrichum kahawae]|uniref:Beta-eliminating lyase n=1 Tax=Colletotrichum kahawae TaxID=34407 RepID=A0AAD9XZZ8_COLKA|nr:beta-eliminating lyase [Colletotrichum kahawae]